MKKTFLVNFIFFFLFVIQVNSQENTLKNTPLKKVFFELEKTYNVKFSYSDNLVNNIFISIQLKNKTLDELLIDIKSQTKLVFQFVTKRYIIVSEKKINQNNICGYLYNSNSDEPILGASINILSSTITTKTDESGYFQLSSLEKNDFITLSYVGYKSKKVSFKELLNKPCVKIYLEEITSVLDEVVITNYLTGGISKKKDGSIDISSKKLGILPGLTEPDVLQSIQLLPGINSPDETASGIHIRGGTPDQNLILFNGIKMYNSAHFFGMISAFNPYITEKIKVYKSGTSASYGNHISGVIDIETDNDLVKKTNGGFGFNLTHADAFLNSKINDKLSFNMSFRRSFTDIFNTNTFSKLSDKVFQNTIISRDNSLTDNDYFSTTDFNFIDFNTKIIYQPSKKDKIIFNQLFIENELEHLFGLKNNTYKTSDLLKIKNLGFSGFWNRKWSANLSQKTSFYFSDYNFDYLYTALFSIQNQNQKGIKVNRINDINFKTELNIKETTKSSFVLGYEYFNNNVSYKLERTYQALPSFDYLLEESNKNNTHAIYGEYIYRNKNKLSIQTGVRSNYFSLTNKYFFAPRIYTQVLISPNIWLKGSLEFKQQNISQLLEFSTSDFGLENQIWALSTKNDVPVLKSKQFTTGFIYKKNNWTIDLDFYSKKIKGLTSLSKGFQTITNNYSEGESNIRGIDFLLQKQWGEYSSWVSYSFNDVNFNFESINNGKSFAGNSDIRHSFLWSHNLKLGNYNFSLGWVFRTGIPYTNALRLDTNNQIVYENELNNSRLTSYHKLDFSSTYSFNLTSNKKWKAKVGLSLLNLYNQNNILERTFSVQVDQNNNFVLNKADTFSLGFTPNIVFRVLF